MSFQNSLTTNPDQFMAELKKQTDPLSLEVAQKIDAEDPLSYTAEMFDIDGLIPFAGHSLGPAFKPALEKIIATAQLQKKLHAGHFPDSHPEGKESGHWFDCDRHEPSLKGAQQLLGFKEMHEFNFTASGLSANLGMLVENFFRPTKKDWAMGSTKIAMLGTEFFSDQSIVHSAMTRAIQTAEDYERFTDLKKPEPQDEILKILPDKNGLYSTENIINAIRKNAAKLKMICLPDIVFNTGQRLELEKIFSAVKDLIEQYQIKVILDLAHSVGNRPLNLESLPVTAAVGCGYKHLSGYAGSSFGIYVSRKVDLKKFPPLQGWKAADPSKVFKIINSFDPSILEQKGGATAFRTSNPPPIALIPVQSFLTEFGKIGFEKFFNKSECLTRYLISQLQHHLGDKIEIITPLDPNQRGATIAVRVKGNVDVGMIEESLKHAGYEVDTRPPNIIRMTAHYAYTKFSQVYHFVNALKKVLEKTLVKELSTSEKIPTVSPALTCAPLSTVGKFKKSSNLLETKRETIPTVYLHR